MIEKNINLGMHTTGLDNKAAKDTIREFQNEIKMSYFSIKNTVSFK